MNRFARVPAPTLRCVALKSPLLTRLPPGTCEPFLCARTDGDTLSHRCASEVLAPTRSEILAPTSDNPVGTDPRQTPRPKAHPSGTPGPGAPDQTFARPHLTGEAECPHLAREARARTSRGEAECPHFARRSRASFHSRRSASRGSIDAARRAGMKAADKPTTSRKPRTTSIAIGSNDGR